MTRKAKVTREALNRLAAQREVYIQASRVRVQELRERGAADVIYGLNEDELTYAGLVAISRVGHAEYFDGYKASDLDLSEEEYKHYCDGYTLQCAELLGEIEAN